MSLWGGLAFWGTLAAIPPLIILLYFLKLRRQPLEIPSTYLWTKTLEDMHVNSLWQRLRRSILLFLQLLIAFLLIMTLLPWANIFQTLGITWRMQKPLDERVILLIDTSASMNADEGGESRLDIALQRAEDLIDRMTSENVAMIISFSDEAKIEQGFTGDQGLLRTKLKRIKTTYRPSNLEEALRAAAGLANPGRSSDAGNVVDVQVADALPATLYLFSDGGVEQVPNFSLGNLEPNYIPIGEQTSVRNAGIILFEASENSEKPGEYQAFAQLFNSGVDDIETKLSLYVNGNDWDHAQVTLPANDSSRFAFDLRGVFDDNADSVELKLVIDEQDQLAIDNEAFAVLNRPRLGRVLMISPGNRALRLALSTREIRERYLVDFERPNVLNDEEMKTTFATGYYDLVIFDRCEPEEMPQSSTMFFGTKPPVETWTAGDPKFPTFVIDTNQAHPVMQLVEMRSILIVDSFAVTGPPGTLSLVDSNVGTIMAIGPRAGFEDLVIGFPMYVVDEGTEVANTSWQKDLSFPVFLHNLVDYMAGTRNYVEALSRRPGEQVIVATRYPGDQITVDEPQGRPIKVRKDARNRFVFHDTEECGIYTVRETAGSNVTQRFAINLFSKRETDLNVRPSMSLGYEQVAGERQWQSAFPKIWKWLLAAGLLVLMVEWYVYNQRVF